MKWDPYKSNVIILDPQKFLGLVVFWPRHKQLVVPYNNGIIVQLP